eukprot:UN00707
MKMKRGPSEHWALLARVETGTNYFKNPELIKKFHCITGVTGMSLQYDENELEGDAKRDIIQ